MDEKKWSKMEEQTRRHFLKNCSLGLGGLVLSSFLTDCKPFSSGIENNIFSSGNPISPQAPHYPGKVKNVIYIHMAGAPSQLELFDYKPELIKLSGKECPPSLMEGKRPFSSFNRLTTLSDTPFGRIAVINLDFFIRGIIRYYHVCGAVFLIIPVAHTSLLFLTL